MTTQKPQLAIFISGRGTNMVNLVRHVQKGKIRAKIALVLSDQPKAPGLAKAKRLGVPTFVLNPKTFPAKVAYEHEIVKKLRSLGVDYVLLAGYMRIVGPTLLGAYRDRILNIHPALLPSFPGAHSIQDAYAHGVRVTGVTVHFVTAQVDGGPIILQKTVEIPMRVGARHALPLLKELERRVHEAEYELYPEAVRLLVEGRLQIQGRRVVIKGK